MALFQEKVWALLKQIPRGKITTYAAIARALGNPKAARAVGNSCNKNPFSPCIPCHRVVCSNGTIGGYAKGAQKKIALLGREGIRIKKSKVLDFNEKLFKF